MKTLVTRPALGPLLACFVCGSSLLTLGLYRWPPVRTAYTPSRRSIGQPSTRDPHADFEGTTAELLPAVGVYLLAALAFTGGLLLWHRRASKGYRLGDLWGKRWAGGKALWLILNLHFVGAAYALLLLVGLGMSSLTGS